MITYSNLVSGIRAIHGTPLSSAPTHAIATEWIPSVVDRTSAKEGAALPVLIAFGANYATGPGSLPSGCGGLILPAVEEKLKRWRNRALAHIQRCKTGGIKPHWNGLLPYEITQPSIPAEVCKQLCEGFHFVMTNACPWITATDWAQIRDVRLEDSFQLLSNGGLNPSFWEYFKALKGLAGQSTVWIGHGNADVYGLFRLLCRKLKISDCWFFDSNLSRPSLMKPRPSKAKDVTVNMSPQSQAIVDSRTLALPAQDLRQ